MYLRRFLLEVDYKSPTYKIDSVSFCLSKSFRYNWLFILGLGFKLGLATCKAGTFLVLLDMAQIPKNDNNFSNLIRNFVIYHGFMCVKK